MVPSTSLPVSLLPRYNQEGPHDGRVAQWIEHQPSKLTVAGSSPASLTTSLLGSEWLLPFGTVDFIFKASLALRLRLRSAVVLRTISHLRKRREGGGTRIVPSRTEDFNTR